MKYTYKINTTSGAIERLPYGSEKTEDFDRDFVYRHSIVNVWWSLSAQQRMEWGSKNRLKNWLKNN